MLRWLVFGCGAAVLAVAAWYFGRPEPAPSAPPSIAVAASPVTPDQPKGVAPAKVVEVIDLSRAYEPAPEPEEFGGLDVVQFIPEPGAPARMPLAVPELEDYFAVFRISSIKIEPPLRERIDVMPRVVPAKMVWERADGSLEPYVESAFVPQGIPFADGIKQPIPPNAFVARLILVEELNVIPRVVREP
jgi:hypothetical protein